jgi:membrane fusion protein, heavy metal efflux system
MQTTEQSAPVDQGNGQAIPGTRPSVGAHPAESEHLHAHAPLMQRVISGLIVGGILVAFSVYVLGVHFPNWVGHRQDDSNKSDDRDGAPSSLPGVSLVPGMPHTVDVSEAARTTLGISNGTRESLAAAQPPLATKDLVLTGSTALDPTRLGRIRARFAPARVVQIALVHDSSASGQSEFRELRPGDFVRKGDVLGIFYSVDAGSKKNDLLDALVQLILDQEILDDARAHEAALPKVFMITQERAVQGDRNAVSRAWNNLKAWDIPQDEIDALQVEAKRLSADKNAWFQTPEGKWVRGEKQAKPNSNGDMDEVRENPWGKVTLRAPFDGVIVERNLHVDEMVVDNTVNLFQVADVSRMLVIANAPEDDLPALENLVRNGQGRWTVKTVGVALETGLPGSIDEISWLIDPNQHTAVIKGYVDNPGRRLRGGQYAAGTVKMPPPAGVVEIPMNALVDDGRQSLVFVQADATKPQYTMRRVQVTQRFDQKVFVRSSSIPKQEQLTAQEAEEGLLPKEPLRAGERVLTTATGELKAAVLSMESHLKK